MKRLLTLYIMLLCAVATQAQVIDRASFQENNRYIASLGPLEGFILKTIVDTITAKCKDEVACKVNAIYYWEATNIDYDCKAFHHPRQHSNSVSSALIDRKAICGGYADLFKAMCDIARIECVTIGGIGKTNTKSIGKLKKKDAHGWNAVNINNTWYLVDVTWAAGSTDRKVKEFTKNYSDAWFMSNRQVFAVSHFPNDKKWQLLDTPMNKSEFAAAPIAGAGAITFDIMPPKKMRGTIKGKEDSSKKFTFYVKHPEQIKSVIETIDGKDLQPVNFSVKGDSLTVDIMFFKHGKFPVSIYVNNAFAFAYNAEGSKKKKVKSKSVKFKSEKEKEKERKQKELEKETEKADRKKAKINDLSGFKPL